MTGLLQTWVTCHADSRPEALAVVGRDDAWTYGALEARSNRLARLLVDAGCRQGDRVCLLMPKSPLAIAALVATYKADCVCVPLDASSPTARLARIIDACEPSCILAGDGVDQALVELAREPRRAAAIRVGWTGTSAAGALGFATRFSLEDAAAYPAWPRDYCQTARHPAHILFTSGSTGMPKGVVITHANVIRFVEWARRYFGMTSADRVSGHSPLHFDLSTFDTFGAFAAGAQLRLVWPELNMVPQSLADFIRVSALTQWFSVPSVLTYLAKFDAVQPHDFPSLKRVLWCGEVLPTPTLIHWMSRLPRVSFTNLYGPTEATIASGYHTVETCPSNPAAHVPIGRACDGEQMAVLDHRLEPVAPGEIGTLYISGAGLSPGYWREPDKTAAAFLPDPRGRERGARMYNTGDLAKVGADGLLSFVGRADSQIKSRGYRIELAEIESVLSTIDVLQESLIVGIPTDGFEGTLIACAYVPARGFNVTAAQLRRRLAELLPSYMLPCRWMALPALPKNGSGKIDRKTIYDRFCSLEAPLPVGAVQDLTMSRPM